MTAMNVVEPVSDDQRESNKQGLFVDSEEMPGDQRILGRFRLTQFKAVGRWMWHLSTPILFQVCQMEGESHTEDHS